MIPRLLSFFWSQGDLSLEGAALAWFCIPAAMLIQLLMGGA